MQHKIMVEQGEHWAVLALTDKSQTAGQKKKGATGGTWRETDDTSSDKAFGFKKDNLAQEFELMLDTLSIGSRSTSQGSHKQGEDPYFQAVLKLFAVKRDATGKLFGEGKGYLESNSGPMKKGDITWSMVRYAH